MNRIVITTIWAILTYYFSFKNNPGYGSMIVLCGMFIAANIFFYQLNKRGESLSITNRFLLLIPLFMYAIFIMGIVINPIPPSVQENIKNISKLLLKIYILFEDSVSIFIAMAILIPIVINIYRNKYIIIVALFTAVFVTYLLMFSRHNTFMVCIAIVSSHFLGSLIAIYLAQKIIQKSETLRRLSSIK
jgi:hypothetical protein